jgi:hypothetical protein
MKVTLTLALALFCFLNNLTAQNAPCFSETFSGSTNGWTYSQGASIHSYNNPANNCSEDRGIVTPGVGGNNPCQVKTPLITSNGGAKVKMTFDMFVMDANLKCNTWKDFACPTSMDVVYYVGSTAYQAAVDYMLPANGPSNSSQVVVNFYVGPNLPAGTMYQVEMFFKFKSGIGNCVQQNTKYIFDNFSICDIEEVAEKGTNHTTTAPLPPSIINTNESLLVYPNPTMGASQLAIPGSIKPQQILISDFYGRILKRQTSATIIDVSGLKKGSYIVQMIKSTGERVSNKLVVN